jgi:EpsI family protein
VWTGKVLPNDPRSLALLETDDVTLMEFRLANEPPVWLVRVGGFGTRAAFHPPEICYVGSDFDVLERGPRTVFINGRARTVMRLVVAQGGDRREAWYWFTAGGRTTPNYWLQQAWLVAGALRRLPTTGTLVHISSPMEQPEAVSRRLLAFLSALDQDAAPRQIASTHAPAPDAF